jgi:hypothetical protein
VQRRRSGRETRAKERGRGDGGNPGPEFKSSPQCLSRQRVTPVPVEAEGHPGGIDGSDSPYNGCWPFKHHGLDIREIINK